MKNFFRPALRLLVLCLVLGSISSCKSDEETTVLGDWTVGNTFPGAARAGAVSFVINNVAYVGTGIDNSQKKYNDMYSYNAASNTWTALTPMPAAAGSRYYAVAFTVGSKGYVGTGYDGTKPLSDFWEFDPSGANGAGSWKQVADLTTATMPGGSATARYYAVAGSAGGTYGYVGAGFDGSNNNKDFFRFNPATNTWSTFAGYPGKKRTGAFAFTLNNQLYVGGGTDNGQQVTDFYSYNPASDTWASHRNLANQTSGADTYDYSGVSRVNSSAFVVNNLGYVTVGSNGAALTNCYEYKPSEDTWTLKNPFKGAGRNSAVAFGIGSYGYVGLGGTSSRFDDFWKFAPDASQD